MSSFKFVLDVGAQFVPGVGRVLDAGLGTYPILNIDSSVLRKIQLIYDAKIEV
jgi:hypothetical protein